MSGLTVIDLCCEELCMDPATHEASVIGGPRLKLCAAHLQKLVDAAREAGVMAKIEVLVLEQAEVTP